MIIIERTWKEPDPRGGCVLLNKTERKCFDDNDVNGVEEFINEEHEYEDEWVDVKYKYTKL